MTTREGHARVMDLFNAAAELSPAERSAFLDRACPDSGLRQEVESLLAHDRAEPFLDQAAIPNMDLGRLAGLDLPEPTVLPDHIGDFKILGLLGSGGMGIVYHARQESPAREVALKLIRPGLATPASRRRFQTEILALARLRHPGIASIYAAATINTPAGPQPYLVMEYVRGTPLLDFVRAQALSRSGRVELLARLCDAIQYAHQQGVIHRDIKPANILVELTDGKPRPRVLDFGVARLMDRPSAATVTTISGHVVGTLTYMSPEQACGDLHNADTRSDVYSLGAVGYELLCGRVPIDVSSSSTYAALQALREHPPISPAALDPALRGDLEIILLKALAKDPEQRYDSAGALAADLRRYLHNEPILARKPSLWYMARKFTARHRLLVGSVALTLVILVAGVAGTVYGLVQARRSGAQLRTQVRETSETATYLVQDVLANMGSISGTDELRQRMLELLNAQVDRLLAQSPGDPALLRARATILSERSDLELADDKCPAALELRLAALELYKSFAKASPHDPEREADVSIALVKVGDVYKEQSDRVSAGAWYRQAFAIDQRLAAQQPESVRFVDNLVWSYLRLGEQANDQGDFDEADRLHRAGEAAVNQLLHMTPERNLTLYAQWQIQHALACIALTRNELSTAESRFRQALATARLLIKREPTHREYVLAAALTQLDLALPVWMPEAEAFQAMDSAIDSMREIYRKDRHDGRVFRLLCGALVKRGQAALEAGDGATAVRRADEILTLLAQADARQSRETSIAFYKVTATDLRARAQSRLETRPASAPGL